MRSYYGLMVAPLFRYYSHIPIAIAKAYLDILLEILPPKTMLTI